MRRFSPQSPDKIRVLHVIDSFDLGGAQTALRNLLAATNRARFSPEVACLHGPGVFSQEFVGLDIPVHVLSPSKWLPLYLPRLLALFATGDFSIAHFHLFGANWIGKPLAAALRVPVIFNHDQCNDRWRYDQSLALWLDRATNQFSTHVCAVSRSTREFLLTREKLAPSCVSLVYNGVDLSRYDSAGSGPETAWKSSRGPLIAGVGRLHPQKNFALFLRVAAELRERRADVHFVIAGTGPEESELRKLAKTLGLEDHVKFAGHVADPRTIYEAADFLLMTSDYEGTPLAILEAMAMRVPIVASHLDGIAEVLADHETARLVPAGEASGFVGALEDLLSDRAKAARLAQAARRHVEQNFSAQSMATQVEALYESALAKRAQTRQDNAVTP